MQVNYGDTAEAPIFNCQRMSTNRRKAGVPILDSPEAREGETLATSSDGTSGAGRPTVDRSWNADALVPRVLWYLFRMSEILSKKLLKAC